MTEKHYIETANGKDVVLYGPFDTQREAAHANFFRVSKWEHNCAHAASNGTFSTLFRSGVYTESEIAGIQQDVEGFGYTSFKVVAAVNTPRAPHWDAWEVPGAAEDYFTKCWSNYRG